MAMIFMLRLLSLGITSVIPIFLTSHYSCTWSDRYIPRRKKYYRGSLV